MRAIRSFLTCLAALALFPVALANALYSSVITPNGVGSQTVYYGQDTTFTLTYKNLATSTSPLGALNVLVPQGFTLAEATGYPVSSPSGKSWHGTVATVAGNRQVIQLRALNASDALAPGEEIQFSITPSMLLNDPAVTPPFPIPGLLPDRYYWSAAAAATHAPDPSDLRPGLDNDSGTAWSLFGYVGGSTPSTKISKATVTTEIAIVEATKTYTGAPLGPTISTNPAINYSVNFVGGGSTRTDIGTYQFTINVSDPNYTGVLGPFTFTIVPNVTLTLSDLSHVYDGQPKQATVGGAGSHSVTVTYNGGSALPVNAGVYDVVASIPELSVQATGQLVIAPRQATVSADDASMTLHGMMPALGYSVEGLVPGDAVGDVVVTTGANAQSGVGEYPITVGFGPGGGNPNYSVTFQGGTLRVYFNLDEEAGAGVQSPVANDGSSVFKKNSTVPIKLRILDANGISIGEPGTIVGIQLAFGVPDQNGEINQPEFDDYPDASFRWSDGQWQYNLKTKDLSAGMAYIFRVTLKGGQTLDIKFKLR